MLTQQDIYRLEIRVRLHADSLRKAAATFDTSAAPEVRAYAARVRLDADEFDQVGNLLVGLQGDWTRLGPLVREGYMAVMAAFERRKVDVARAGGCDVPALENNVAGEGRDDNDLVRVGA